jgi:dTDP-4-dehydrorhamnose 3,5-epimerase-like enzyme
LKVREIQLNAFRDSRGELISGEYPKDLPFNPVRFFVINNVPTGATRGNHAHKSNEQLLVCLTGSLKIKIHDGEKWETFVLNSNSKALYIPPGHWGELTDFQANTQLLVLASEPYSPTEYLTDFADFLTFTQ